MLPWIQIGPFALWSYGLMLGLGFVLCFFLGEADFKRRGIEIPMGIFMPCMVLSALIGAKLDNSLVTQWLVFHRNPLAHSWTDILMGGYTGLGGVLACIPCGWLLARIYRIPVFKIADIAPVALVGAACCRMGCFLAGDGDYGIPTSLPWGMSFPHGIVPTTLRVHPTCLYESAGALLLFAILWPMGSRRRYQYRRPGTIFACFLLGMGALRFPIEFLSRNPRIYARLTEAQWVSIGFLLSAITLLVALRRPGSHTLAAAESGDSKAALIETTS